MARVDFMLKKDSKTEVASPSLLELWLDYQIQPWKYKEILYFAAVEMLRFAMKSN